MSFVYSTLYSLLFLFLIVHSQQPGDEKLCPPEFRKGWDCCDETKPLECVYKKPQEQIRNKTCHCAPKATKNRKIPEEATCTWSAKYFFTTDFGNYTPCHGFYRLCDDTEQADIECANYPPPWINMKDSGAPYCNFLNRTADVYDVFFTCWLYNCNNRFEKKKETKDAKGLEWCYPPAVLDPYVKNCKLYEVDPNITEYYEMDRSNNKFCALPPFCNASRLVDTVNYMPARSEINGTSNSTHCEKLCEKKGNNNGTDEDGLPCRVIPSCKENTHLPELPGGLTNRYQVPICLDWCSGDDSYVKSGSYEMRNKSDYGINGTDGKHCNPLPICEQFVDAQHQASKVLYGPSNLYAAVGFMCMKRIECDKEKGQTSATHFCDEDAVQMNTTTEMPASAGLSTPAIIIIIVVAILFMFAVIGMVIFSVRKKMKENVEENQKTIALQKEHMSADQIELKVTEDVTARHRESASPVVPGLSMIAGRRKESAICAANKRESDTCSNDWSVQTRQTPTTVSHTKSPADGPERMKMAWANIKTQ